MIFKVIIGLIFLVSVIVCDYEADGIISLNLGHRRPGDQFLFSTVTKSNVTTNEMVHQVKLFYANVNSTVIKLEAIPVRE